jgi:biopolymer transport protein ExbD
MNTNKKKHRESSVNTSFVDLLFCLLIVFIIMYTLQLLLISPKKNQEAPKPQEMYTVQITWGDNESCDVDTWVMDPANNLTSFNRRDDGLMHLDRDDLGNSNDMIELQNGIKIPYNKNKEEVRLRRIVPGQYIVNVHMFNIKKSIPPVEVTGELRNNFTGDVITVKTVELERTGHEETLFRFRLDGDGNVIDVTTSPKRLATNPMVLDGLQ